MEMVAEGVKTTKAVHYWARKNSIEMPITSAVYQVLFEGVNPIDAMTQLMNRDPKQEGLQALLMDEYEQYLKYSGTTTFSSMSKVS